MHQAFGWCVHRRGAPECAALSAPAIGSAMAAFWEKNGEPSVGAEDIYHEDWNRAFNVLFLFNAAFCWSRGERYSFARHCEVGQWSLEHIFARNQRPLADAAELAAFCPALQEKWAEYSLAKEQDKGDDWLAGHIPDGQYPKEEDSSLRNLALLSGSDNSSFNNSLFNGKRANLIAGLNAGHWFPPATVAVFQKAFPGMDPLKPYLSDSDKDAYRKAMQEVVTRFVKEVKKVWEA